MQDQNYTKYKTNLKTVYKIKLKKVCIKSNEAFSYLNYGSESSK